MSPSKMARDRNSLRIRNLLKQPCKNVPRILSYGSAEVEPSDMSLLRFCEWLANTPGSIALHESRYVFLIVLTVHVLTLAVFVGTAVMIDLRVLGVTMMRVPASEVLARLLPWTTAGFLVMVTSGTLLFYSAPLVRYHNLFFRFKMMALVLALLNAWVFHA